MSRVSRDIMWVIGVFVVLGVGGGLLWWLLAHPPYYVRTAQGAVMDQAELAKRIQADGTFMVVGLVAGLLAGLVLTRWRDRAPLVTLLVGVAAAVGAGFLALWLGRMLGHVDVSAAVRSAKVGGHVTDTLSVITPTVVLTWPLAYLVGAVAMLWGTNREETAPDRGSDAPPPELHQTGISAPQPH